MKTLKFTSLFTVLVLSVGLLAGCGSSGTDDPGSETVNSSSQSDAALSSGSGSTVSQAEAPVDKPSEGLYFGLTDARDSYAVKGIGSCKDKDIVIPDSYEGLPVTEIGNNAFRGEEDQDDFGINSVVIPDSVTSIGANAFKNCYDLMSITISNGVTSIGFAAFENCYKLTDITIPDSVTNIGRAAFANCKSLTDITIPGSVTLIGYQTFMDCTSLANVTISEGVTSIEYDAFSGCTSLTEITIPGSVTLILTDTFSQQNAFSGCINLTSITYNGTTAEWEELCDRSTWRSNSNGYIIHCTDGDISEW